MRLEWFLGSVKAVCFFATIPFRSSAMGLLASTPQPTISLHHLIDRCLATSSSRTGHKVSTSTLPVLQIVHLTTMTLSKLEETTNQFLRTLYRPLQSNPGAEGRPPPTVWVPSAISSFSLLPRHAEPYFSAFLACAVMALDLVAHAGHGRRQ